MDDDIEVAWRSACFAALAFAGDAQLGAGVDSGWNLYLHRPFALNATGSPALAARVPDDLARTAACRAGAADREEPLLIPDLTGTAAGLTASRRTALSRARSVA